MRVLIGTHREFAETRAASRSGGRQNESVFAASKTGTPSGVIRKPRSSQELAVARRALREQNGQNFGKNEKRTTRGKKAAAFSHLSILNHPSFLDPQPLVFLRISQGLPHHANLPARMKLAVRNQARFIRLAECQEGKLTYGQTHLRHRRRRQLSRQGAHQRVDRHAARKARPVACGCRSSIRTSTSIRAR